MSGIVVSAAFATLLLSSATAHATSDVLWWSGNDGCILDHSYTETSLLDAGATTFTDTSVWPHDLSVYSVILLGLSATSYSASQAQDLVTFVEDGGTLVFLSDSIGIAPTPAIFNDLLNQMGSQAMFLETSLDNGCGWEGTVVLDDEVTRGIVGGLSYAASGDIVNTTPLVLGVSNQVLVGEAGGMVLMSDVNLVVDDCEVLPGNTTLLANLIEGTCGPGADRDDDGHDRAWCGGDDCDDGDPLVHPTAGEVCNGADDDCDGDVDENALGTWYIDQDGDRFGLSPIDCDGSNGSLDSAGDCDDSDGAVHPGTVETCDGRDQDCDGLIDEDAVDMQTWYADQDDDGFGTGNTFPACEEPALASDIAYDCDDLDSSLHPGAPELCDGVDQDCDGRADDNPIDAPTWYPDADGDGYGPTAAATSDCIAPEGAVSEAGDCDDTRSQVHPNAAEICDYLDDDCNGLIDDDPADGTIWYIDADGDGFGIPGETTTACDEPPGTADNPDDCDDSDPAAWPGASLWTTACEPIPSHEVPSDDPAPCGCASHTEPGVIGLLAAIGLLPLLRRRRRGVLPGILLAGLLGCHTTARDTAPIPDLDSDGDGYTAGEDCDDDDVSVAPGHDEVCNGKDDDCDGLIDEDPTIDASLWYLDADGDGYGTDTSIVRTCDAPDGFVPSPGDCDDDDVEINPSAVETCDGLDQDCDSAIDDSATDAPTWYPDADADGYGSENGAIQVCDEPFGFRDQGGDCDDLAPAIHPGADERCDGADNDCDGVMDESDATDAEIFHADLDADTYGDPDNPVPACTQPPSVVENDDDCDDADPNIHPGAPDVCGDGKDNDCDGQAESPCVTLDLGGSAMIVGQVSYDTMGAAVADLGDLDGDDIDDLLVSATGSTYDGFARAGYAAIFLGPVTGVHIGSDADYRLHGAASDLVGTAVAAADLDLDGFTDVLASSYCASQSLGETYLFRGPITADVEVGAADATWRGSGNIPRSGFALATLDDLGGDGFGDILIGTFASDFAWIVTQSVVGLASLTTNAWVLTGETSGDYAGYAVASADDVDGDGVGDMLIGAPKAAGAGIAYLVLGPVTADISLANADARLLGVTADDEAGFALSAAGDMNGDGYDDVLVGAPGLAGLATTTGKVYLLHGPLSGDMDLSMSDAILQGNEPEDMAGSSIAGGLDIDQDGTPDLLVGVKESDIGGFDAGAAYLALGPLSGTLMVGDSWLEMVGGSSFGRAGTSVAFGGDTDADGIPDLLVAAPSASIGATENVGAVHLVSGSQIF